MFKLEDPTTAEIFQQQVPIRNATLKDETGTIKVELWRQHSKLDIEEGSQLELENVTTSTFNRTKTVNTNCKTKILVSFQLYVIEKTPVSCQQIESFLNAQDSHFWGQNNPNKFSML